MSADDRIITHPCAQSITGSTNSVKAAVLQKPQRPISNVSVPLVCGRRDTPTPDTSITLRPYGWGWTSLDEVGRGGWQHTPSENFVGVSTCNRSASCGKAREGTGSSPAGSRLDGEGEVVSVVSRARTSFIPSPFRLG